MTKDDIIDLAKQAGFADCVVEIVGLYGFMKFANLVAGVEREEILQMSRDKWFKTQADFEAAIAARWKHD